MQETILLSTLYFHYLDNLQDIQWQDPPNLNYHQKAVCGIQV